MPLLAGFFALLVPRVTIVVLWLFTDWFTGVFGTLLWPLLGFIFAPLTLLWYSVVYHWFGGQWDVIPIVGLVVVILVDLSPTTRFRRRRVVVVEE